MQVRMSGGGGSGGQEAAEGAVWGGGGGSRSSLEVAGVVVQTGAGVGSSAWR